MSDAKNILRRFLKDNNLQSSLGEVTITREIGEGGNGLVFEGTLHDTPIAIKFLINPDRHKLTRFQAEYLNVVMLPSNKFVAKPLLYQEFIISEDKFSAIMLKKYDGHLKRPETPTKEALRSLTQFLLDSLHFIHSHGIIHRDLKPENILQEGETYFLADFGIASYNPEMFRLMADTRKGERLGNRKFSAPEQEEGGVEAHPTMDIYAFGQLVQWFITGSIHRGTQRTQISSIIPNSEVYDFIIDGCLANNPSQRFQSVTDIKKAANDFIQSRKEPEQKRPEFIDPFDNYLYPFADAARVTFPKVSGGVVYTDDKKRIDRFISKLSDHDFDTRLWWTDGMRDMYFKFTKIDDETWLMGDGKNGDEVRVKSMWLYYSPSVYGDVVLLTMEAMPPFGVYEEREINLDEYHAIGLIPSEEAVLIDNKYYITRAEFDNGFAEINDEVMELTGHEKAVRTRYLDSYSVFIGTTFHNVLQRESESNIRAFIKKHNRGEGITYENFDAFADSIRQNLDENVLNFL